MPKSTFFSKSSFRYAAMSPKSGSSGAWGTMSAWNTVGLLPSMWPLMLESLDRDFVASCVAEELRMLEQAAVRRSASRQGCRWRRPLGYLWGSRQSSASQRTEATYYNILPGGDERYGIRFDINDYLVPWSLPYPLACSREHRWFNHVHYNR